MPVCPGTLQVETRVHMSAVRTCASGPCRYLLDTSVFLDPVHLSGSAHVGMSVRFPFRLCLFL